MNLEFHKVEHLSEADSRRFNDTLLIAFGPKESATASDTAGKYSQSAAMRRIVGDLITRLADDEFDVREKADQELRKLGSAAFEELSKHTDDPEVKRRAHRILRSVAGSPPTALLQMKELIESASADISKSGKISLNVSNRYKVFIDQSPDYKLGGAEQRVRQQSIETRRQLEAKTSDRVEAFRQEHFLSIMRTEPASLARLDLAGLLLKYDKPAAIKVLSEAVTSDPALVSNDGFKQLARVSGAIDSKAFLKTLDASSGKNNTAKNWKDAVEVAKQDFSLLHHESVRRGLTAELEKSWDKLVKALERQAANDKDLSDLLTNVVQRHRLEHLLCANQPGKALTICMKMHEKDRSIETRPWFQQIIDVTGVPLLDD
jgi:hypothetical protein